ncbi:MAG: 3-hydroxyacyl-CoA dehydrogenase family protein [Dehalococcoidales bacterium]|nr:3-hydroxyacyl-CoA dehydrogenase family protein [Dehalococcoidales bacterium]
MKLEDVKTIAVVGSGNMGAQIALLCSQLGGYNVVMTDMNQNLVDAGLKRQKDQIQKYFVDKGKLTADQAKDILGRISGTAKLADAVSKADVVIEAVFENMALKKDIFKQIDAAAPPHAVLATNTSYLSVTEIASVTKRPQNVTGMHFFNPPAVMKLVEVVRAVLTTPEAAAVIFDLAKKLNKEPIYCRDTYGFLANRCATITGDEDAIELLWSHVAPPEDIDRAVRLGFNRPMGPLELGDLTGGWNIQVTGEEDRIKELGFAKGHVHPMIRMMVRAGYTGGPGKKGVYDFWKEVISKW